MMLYSLRIIYSFLRRILVNSHFFAFKMGILSVDLDETIWMMMIILMKMIVKLLFMSNLKNTKDLKKM